MATGSLVWVAFLAVLRLLAQPKHPYAEILSTTSQQSTPIAESKTERPAMPDRKIMNSYGVPIIF